MSNSSFSFSCNNCKKNVSSFSECILRTKRLKNYFVLLFLDQVDLLIIIFIPNESFDVYHVT